MIRDIMTDLIYWKNNPARKPLIITGVGQCGKTHIIKQFAREQFENQVYLNFEESKNLAAVFDYDYNVDRIIRELELIFGEKIIPGKTLLFLDEVQECPKAVNALMYFCEGRKDLHIIYAGSRPIVFPAGKVNRLQILPMSFHEFAVSCGQKDLIEMFRNWPLDRAVPELYAEPMNKLMKEYMVVGGMPEAVQTWVETRDFAEVDKVLTGILKTYEEEFSNYAMKKDAARIRWVWDSVPVQLVKPNNKFVFSHVKEGMRSADLEDAMKWLADAGLVVPVYLVDSPEAPLSAFTNLSFFKLYMSDVGLLRIKSGVSAETVMEETDAYQKYKNAFAENYVLNELRALGKEPFFWRSGNSAEVDFVYEDIDEVIPVEIKAADNKQAKSYKQYCKNYRPPFGIRLSEKNIDESKCENTRTLSLPRYMCWNIDHYLDEEL